jgi:hypothetical protein
VRPASSRAELVEVLAGSAELVEVLAGSAELVEVLAGSAELVEVLGRSAELVAGDVDLVEVPAQLGQAGDLVELPTRQGPALPVAGEVRQEYAIFDNL